MLLPGRDQLAHAVGEHLGAAAGQRAEPGRLELAQHLLVGQPGERRHVVDLGGRVALEVHVRQRLVQRADRLDVEVEVDVRVLAVDHVDLGEPGQLALAHRVLDELLGGDRVGVLLLLRRREGAELALHAADVRLVQVEVLDEVDLVGRRRAAGARGRRARRARAGRPTRAARGRPRGRAARPPRPSRGSARACCRSSDGHLSAPGRRRRTSRPRAPPGASSPSRHARASLA